MARGLERGMDAVQELANVIYHEARGESREGQIAVGHVVMNRVADDRFGRTVYEVVWQRNQFSGLRYYSVPESFLQLAKDIIDGKIPSNVGKSLYFNNFQRKNCKYRIGLHCFR